MDTRGLCPKCAEQYPMRMIKGQGWCDYHVTRYHMSWRTQPCPICAKDKKLCRRCGIPLGDIENLTINESEYPLANGKMGKIAVFIYMGTRDPHTVLSAAVEDYVGEHEYYELLESSMDNPWMRVIVSNINDMKQEPFNSEFHKLG